MFTIGPSVPIFALAGLCWCTRNGTGHSRVTSVCNPDIPPQCGMAWERCSWHEPHACRFCMRVTNTACAFKIFSTVLAKCMNVLIAPGAQNNVHRQLLTTTPARRQLGCGFKEARQDGGLGLRIAIDRWHLILGILCIRVCGTERPTVFGGALLSKHGNLGGPKFCPLVPQVGDGARHGWKPAPVAPRRGAQPHARHGVKFKMENRRAKRWKCIHVPTEALLSQTNPLIPPIAHYEHRASGHVVHPACFQHVLSLSYPSQRL